MRNERLRIIIGFMFLLLFAFIIPAYGEDNVPRISTEQLKEMLGGSDLVLLDGRIAKEWRKSDNKIVGAKRVDPHDVSSWEGDYSKDQKIVVYCS
jgi:rhodanese-related sulfurtransferase